MAATAYRRSGTEARRVRTPGFDKLPSVVRERLTSCLAHGGAPAPLLVAASRRKPLSAFRWLLIAAVAGLVEIELWSLGLGDPSSALAFHPLWCVAVQAVVIFTLL